MPAPSIRRLDSSEIAVARSLYNSYPDWHAQRVYDWFPKFPEIERLQLPDERLVANTKFGLGAFDGSDLVASILCVCQSGLTNQALTESEEEALWDNVSDEELERYQVLYESYWRTFIGAPDDALLLSSLSVAEGYRRQGLARRLICEAIETVPESERELAYIEVARIRWLQRLCETTGFRLERKTFSVSERLEYGCWGSALYRYRPDADS